MIAKIRLVLFLYRSDISADGRITENRGDTRNSMGNSGGFPAIPPLQFEFVLVLVAVDLLTR